ncbi:cation:H+ antiporter [Alteribacillus persepolensis]|uniref:Cation:H+ antiporter n=1 Tax=Alteribacillus persepolensis TaxID=568899 RepID=A0A1G8EP09_9BACI|nr:sodium:calcium antiporter [Alteribacillus persepolensis]SDH71595.1 cation:H+ antiporter [Alteribacillus persepolensis]
MLFVYFFIAAAITVAAAVKLSTYADVISEKSKWGGMMVGTVLLAGATSLPEVTTTVTAVSLNNPDIAVGNVLGSNMFNLLIIAVFDLCYRKEQLFSRTSISHTYTASLGIFLALMAWFAMLVKTDTAIFGIGIDTIIILAVYALGMAWINKQPNAAPVSEEEDTVSEKSPAYALSLRHAQIGFVIAAIIILIAGSILTVTGDQIALVTGLGSSFVGSFLIAASTSLPEAIAVLIALQLQNHNLALGSILGSNLFNIILLGLSDIAYRSGPIIAASNNSHQVTAAAVTLLAAIALFSILRGRKQLFRLYTWPSALLVVLYFLSSYFIFTY